jgi:hypothetical protein
MVESFHSFCCCEIYIHIVRRYEEESVKMSSPRRDFLEFGIPFGRRLSVKGTHLVV